MACETVALSKRSRVVRTGRSRRSAFEDGSVSPLRSGSLSKSRSASSASPPTPSRESTSRALSRTLRERWVKNRSSVRATVETANVAQSGIGAVEGVPYCGLGLEGPETLPSFSVDPVIDFSRETSE